MVSLRLFDGSSRSSVSLRHLRCRSLGTSDDDPPGLQLPSGASCLPGPSRSPRGALSVSSLGVRPASASRDADRLPAPPSTTGETLRSRRAPRSNAEAVCVHSEVWSRRSPDAPSPLGPEVASSRSRSDPAVSRRFAGFLHTRAANVAVRCRPWGSLAFRRDGRVDRSIRLPLSPRREPPLEGLLRAPAPRQSPVVGYLPALLALSLLLLRSTAVSSCRVCRLRVSPMRSEVFLRSPSGVRPTRRFLRVSGPSFLGFSSLRGLLSRELRSRAAREREPRIRSGSTDRAPSR